MPHQIRPVVSRKAGATGLHYELSNRVHVASAYPFDSVNDSVPIIYGHETGITVLWRGGLPLKPNGQDATRPFQGEEDEPDPSNPYPPIVQDYTFSLGTGVLDISFPPLPHLRRKRAGTSLPSIFRRNIIVAATCSDRVVRVLLLGLDPPLDALKDSYLAEIIGTIPLTDLATTVSLSWNPTHISPRPKDAEGDVDMDTFPSLEDDGTASNEQEVDRLDILVAIGTSSGTLQLATIDLEVGSNNSISYDDDLLAPFQKIYLPEAPLRVSFSSATHPSSSYSQVLVAHASGTVRIYDFLQSRGQDRSKPSDEKPQDYPTKGSWVANFSSPLASSSSDAASYGTVQRKRVLDAQWVLQGRAIITLLADGEWGVWNVDATLPRVQSSNGNGTFSLWGSVGSGIPRTTASLGQEQKSRSGRPTLSAMTPKTRRVKEESLFSGPQPSPTTGGRGGIKVTAVPLPSQTATEDSIAVWHNDAVYAIDSLQSFWNRLAKDNVSSKTLSRGGSLSGPGLTKIDGLNLHNQSISSVSHIPIDEEDVTSVKHDLLISTQHELIIHTVLSKRPADQVNTLLSSRFLGRELDSYAKQQLLGHGELDLGALDSMMESMEQEDIFASGTLPPRPRAVGFAN